MSEISIPCPSVASIAAGLHEAGETITVTGAAYNLRHHITKQEHPWVTFSLTDNRTGIEVEVHPQRFEAIGHTEPITSISAPVEEGWDRSLRAVLYLTVTGRVGTLSLVPKLYATSVHIKP